MEIKSEITVLITSSSGISSAWDLNSEKQKKPRNNMVVFGSGKY